MSAAGNGLTPERRAMLAAKGRRLYGKFCGTGGRGICAESFAAFHVGRGEPEVALDLVSYLDAVVAELESSDPHGRLSPTRGLAERVRKHLAAAPRPAAGTALRDAIIRGHPGDATMPDDSAIETRLKAVEAGLDELRRRLPPDPDWLRQLIGSQADDPAFEEVVALGRAAREADRPDAGPPPS